LRSLGGGCTAPLMARDAHAMRARGIANGGVCIPRRQDELGHGDQPEPMIPESIARSMSLDERLDVQLLLEGQNYAR
jgi:hypothetical protein